MEQQKFHYATVTEAITKLKEQGYTHDFSLEGDHFKDGEETFTAADFEIADLYRYEGPSDPADEAVVYALVSAAGVKGTLVTGYGVSTDDATIETLKNLHYKYQQKQQG